MVQTLVTISVFAGVGAFALCSVLLNEGRHAARRRERARPAQEPRRPALWSPSLVAPRPKPPPTTPRAGFAHRAAALFGRVGSGVESVGAREAKRALLASMLLALVALLRGSPQRIASVARRARGRRSATPAAVVRRALTRKRSRLPRLAPGRGPIRSGRTPSLPW